MGLANTQTKQFFQQLENVLNEANVNFEIYLACPELETALPKLVLT